VTRVTIFFTLLSLFLPFMHIRIRIDVCMSLNVYASMHDDDHDDDDDHDHEPSRVGLWGSLRNKAARCPCIFLTLLFTL
jgi:hypothetical protein